MKLLKRHLTCLIIALIIGLIANEIILQHYLRIFFNSTWRFYSPTHSYKLTYYLWINRVKFGDSAENILMITFLASFITYIATLVILRSFTKLESDRHGTAHFTALKEILQSSLIKANSGVFIGSIEHNNGNLITRHDSKKEMHLLPLIDNSDKHVLLFAPTGSGKGVGVIIPTLLTWQESVIVYDIKGENFEKTAKYRENILNNIVYKFAPTSQNSAKYNPLDAIRIGTEYEIQDAQNIAMQIIDDDGKGLDTYWKKSGFDLLTGTILHILYCKKSKSLTAVALFIDGINPDDSSTYKNEATMLKEMIGVDNPTSHLVGLAEYKNIPLAIMIEQLGNSIDADGNHIFIKSTANKLIGKADAERTGIIGTVSSLLNLYKDPIISKNTATSDFSFTDIQQEQAKSIYLVISSADRSRLKPLIRLFITQAIQTIQASMHNKDKKLLFLIDEFPELKKLPELISALATIRGYKVRFLLVVQDYLQLIEHYGESQSIFSNSGIRICYTPNDLKTAKLISDMLGTVTYIAQTTNTSSSRQPFAIVSSTSTSTHTQESARALMTPDEVLRLNKDKSIIFIEGQKPILADKYRYFEDKKMMEKIG